MTYFLVAWIAGLVGFVIGLIWRGWVEEGRAKELQNRREAQDRRLKLILLGVSASVAAGHGVIHRVVDIQPTKVN